MMVEHLQAWRSLRDALQHLCELLAHPPSDPTPIFSHIERVQQAQTALPPLPQELAQDDSAEDVDAVRDLAQESLALNRSIQEKILQHMRNWEQDGLLDERRRRTLGAYTTEAASPRFIDRRS